MPNRQIFSKPNFQDIKKKYLYLFQTRNLYRPKNKIQNCHRDFYGELAFGDQKFNFY